MRIEPYLALLILSLPSCVGGNGGPPVDDDDDDSVLDDDDSTSGDDDDSAGDDDDSAGDDDDSRTRTLGCDCSVGSDEHAGAGLLLLTLLGLVRRRRSHDTAGRLPSPDSVS